MALADVLSARATRPGLPVRIVTNGTTVLDPEMRHLLSYADELVVRIDAGGEAVSRIRSGPSHAEIDAALRLLPDLSVESFFVDGDRGNTGERQVDEWIRCVARLRPRCVYVTTVAGAPLEDGVRAADASTLERIAVELWSRTRLPTIVLP
jgi:wyosine [tRNA(Phe)-imidazoG37] synthetase (radical SAM superfamily)